MYQARLNRLGRVLVRLDRLHVSPEQTRLPIPSIAGKQFVVAKAAVPESEEPLARELFWYREAFLKRLTATWREVSGAVCGDDALRFVCHSMAHCDMA